MSRLTKRNADGTAWYNHTAEREIKNGDILEKLAHYEDLEEAGRLITLPCKVGDMAYYIDKENKIQYGVVHEITIGQRFCWFTLRREVIVFKDKKGGRTSEFFLTKAEAEAKLKLLQPLPILHGNIAPNSKEEALERLGISPNKLAELKGDSEER